MESLYNNNRKQIKTKQPELILVSQVLQTNSACQFPIKTEYDICIC